MYLKSSFNYNHTVYSIWHKLVKLFIPKYFSSIIKWIYWIVCYFCIVEWLTISRNVPVSSARNIRMLLDLMRSLFFHFSDILISCFVGFCFIIKKDKLNNICSLSDQKWFSVKYLLSSNRLRCANWLTLNYSRD